MSAPAAAASMDEEEPMAPWAEIERATLRHMQMRPAFLVAGSFNFMSEWDRFIKEHFPREWELCKPGRYTPQQTPMYYRQNQIARELAEVKRRPLTWTDTRNLTQLLRNNQDIAAFVLERMSMPILHAIRGNVGVGENYMLHQMHIEPEIVRRRAAHRDRSSIAQSDVFAHVQRIAGRDGARRVTEFASAAITPRSIPGDPHSGPLRSNTEVLEQITAQAHAVLHEPVEVQVETLARVASQLENLVESVSKKQRFQ